MSSYFPTSSQYAEYGGPDVRKKAVLDKAAIYRRLYMKEELDSLQLATADAEMIRKSCVGLGVAAEYFYKNKEEQISQGFVSSEFELILKSGMISTYIEQLETLIEKIGLTQLQDAIALSTSPPLRLIPELWNELFEAVIFIFENFCPQTLPYMDIQSKLIESAKKIFREKVLVSSYFSSIGPMDFQNKLDVNKSAVILNLVSPNFFSSYVEDITLDYVNTVNEMIEETIHPRQFTKMITGWLDDELKTCKLLGFTEPQMTTFLQRLYKVFVMDFLTPLLKKDTCFDLILEQLDCAVFHIWFMLYSRVENGLDVLMELVSGYMSRKCEYFAKKKTSFDRSVLPTAIIKDLISFKKVIDLLQSECCNGDSTFKSRIQSQLHRVFNSVDKFAEFLAIYFDVELRQNKVDQIDNVLGLVHYVSNKEDFERLYKVYLARRLVGANGHSLSIEKMVIESLKVEFGNAYTRRMEKMLKDLEMSAELLQDFAISANLTPAADGIFRNGLKFSITVVTPGFWPQMQSLAPCSLPSQLSSAFHDFEHFYTQKYPTRKLALNIFNGNVVVQAKFLGEQMIKEVKEKIEKNENSLIPLPSVVFTIKSLICSPVQTAVLDLFNSSCYIDSNKLKSMGDNELQKGIPSLVRSKILIKEVMMDINGNEKEVFYVNDMYNHKKSTINLTKESKNDEEKHKKTEGLGKNIQACRYLIEAAIVRILKTCKTLAHDDVKKMVANRLEKPIDENTLKKCLENLIDHHYLKRDDNNPKVYHYEE